MKRLLFIIARHTYICTYIHTYERLFCVAIVASLSMNDCLVWQLWLLFLRTIVLCGNCGFSFYERLFCVAIVASLSMNDCFVWQLWLSLSSVKKRKESRE